MNNTTEFVPNALDLFEIPPTQCGIKRVQWVDFRPISQITHDSPIEFYISGAGSDYVDLSRSYLQIRARITKQGVGIDDEEEVTPTNLWLHSLFTQCDITVQQKLLYNSGRLYAYKAYFETIDAYTHADGPRLATEMFYKDSNGAMDSVSIKDPDQLNVGLVHRHLRLKGGKVCEMMGRLHGDLCQLNKIIPNGVNIGI
jgi:hypothetical protein